MWYSICQENKNPFFTTKKKKGSIIRSFGCEMFKARARHSPAKQRSFSSVCIIHLHSKENT